MTGEPPRDPAERFVWEQAELAKIAEDCAALRDELRKIDGFHKVDERYPTLRKVEETCRRVASMPCPLCLTPTVGSA